MSITITTRVKKEMLREIDEFSRYNNMDRATMLRNLIDVGLDKERTERVLKLYSERKISLGKSAEMLDMDMFSFIDLINKEKILIDYGEDELKEDLKGFK